MIAVNPSLLQSVNGRMEKTVRIAMHSIRLVRGSAIVTLRSLSPLRAARPDFVREQQSECDGAFCAPQR